MSLKYAIVVSEYSATYEDEKLIGWDNAKGSPRLLLFDDEDAADGHIQDLGESQDCDYKVEIQRIGWVHFTLPA